MTNKNPSTGVAPRSQFHFSDGRCCRMLRLTPARFTGRRESGQFHFSGNGVNQDLTAFLCDHNGVRRQVLTFKPLGCCSNRHQRHFGSRFSAEH